jgi:hypothetical protein
VTFMINSLQDPRRVQDRNRLIALDGGLPLVLTTLIDAGRLADAIAVRLFERHRGAYADEDGTIVVFGNDGFADDKRSRREVAQVVEDCQSLGLGLEAFGVCRDGYTWALVMSCPCGESDETLVSSIQRAVWDAWCDASGVPRPSDRVWAVLPPGTSATTEAMHEWSRDGF